MIELLFGGANARGARATSAPSSRSAPAAAIRRRCSRRLGKRVVSVERLKAAARQGARAAGADARRRACAWSSATACCGHPPGAPYDSIIAAAGGDEIPQAWLDQLAVGGRLVSPVQQRGGGQVLVVVDRHADGYDRSVHEAVNFVPLKSGLVR